MSGYDPQVIHIVLFFTVIQSSVSVERSLKNSLGVRVDL